MHGCFGNIGADDCCATEDLHKPLQWLIHICLRNVCDVLGIVDKEVRLMERINDVLAVPFRRVCVPVDELIDLILRYIFGVILFVEQIRDEAPLSFFGVAYHSYKGERILVESAQKICFSWVAQ